MILTIDLGTSATKALVWDLQGAQAAGRATVSTTYGPGGRVEQDAGSWWASVGRACDVARHSARGVFDSVEAIALSSARQTFVPVSSEGKPLGPALLWSDRRGGDEARRLAGMLGGTDAVKARTGITLDGGAVAAKVAWLAGNEPDRMSAARWLLGPREVVVRELTGEVCTDATVASASGLYDTSGALVAELGDAVRDKLPEVRASMDVAGTLLAEPARRLGLRAGIPVVIGAGDRACEVLGTGASPTRAMVSWGTTANVSVPVDTRLEPLPPGLTTSRGALNGWVVEGGVSAAGSLLELVASLTGTGVPELWTRARDVAPGAAGLVMLPWIGGARAPWWDEGARPAIIGLEPSHGAGDLARAALEAVAWDIVRCIELAVEATGVPHLQGLVLAGGGGREPAWNHVLTGITGLAARRRRSGEAASAGAAVLGWRALGTDAELELFDPISDDVYVDTDAARRYRSLRATADAAAAAVLPLRLPDTEPQG